MGLASHYLAGVGGTPPELPTGVMKLDHSRRPRPRQRSTMLHGWHPSVPGPLTCLRTEPCLSSAACPASTRTGLSAWTNSTTTT
eukprot:8478655-Heterocapsa_arctica.AAC.1